ncbi:PREDICTED: uncharacterized protein LOC109226035 [Nicotiana attenuata]|uniref:uncharacterized protein LOC109226035 n=1 Tax=Nicotiana attenuata TaxID=49451 RepID=UPI000904C137|nr:PREDICTED: uncharacterized protein LOC109226035 [Nicotiana attenuata]
MACSEPCMSNSFQEFLSAQIVHEQVQQKSLNSTSLASQALREQLQQKSLDSTTCTSQTVHEQFEDSSNHETNKQSEEQGPSAEKRKRVKTLMPSVHGRKERKLIVVNENNQPIGPTDDVVAELGSFLGTLARNAAFCPLNVFNWRKLQTKEDMWKYIKGKYGIPDASKKWVFESIQNAWRKYKNQLFSDHYKPYENDELRMEKRSVDVPESQFRDLLNYWNSDAYNKSSQTNTENHKKLKYPHTAGKRSFARICKEKKKETSEPLSSKDIFVATRKRKPDRVYKASYADTLNKIAEMERIQPTQESEDGTQSVDAFASVMAPEHPGRLMLYGCGVTKTSLKRKVGDLGPSTDEVMQQKLEEMEERMQQRLQEKFNAQKDAVELQVAVSMLVRLEKLPLLNKLLCN